MHEANDSWFCHIFGVENSDGETKYRIWIARYLVFDTKQSWNPLKQRNVSIWMMDFHQGDINIYV